MTSIAARVVRSDPQQTVVRGVLEVEERAALPLDRDQLANEVVVDLRAERNAEPGSRARDSHRRLAEPAPQRRELLSKAPRP